LRVDTHVLRETGTALRTVATEFENANARSDSAAEATGHRELAEKVQEFAHNWDDRRKKMVKNIQNLAEAASKTGEAFETLDSEFAAALKGKK
jgi:hypothetical protein